MVAFEIVECGHGNQHARKTDRGLCGTPLELEDAFARAGLFPKAGRLRFQSAESDKRRNYSNF
jgi:hypothetical protein